MVRRRGVEGVPADHVVGAFPDGEVPDGAPAAARYAVAVARALRTALRDRALAAVCRDAGLARSTVQDLLAGRTWPDLVTLAKLEEALDVRLWPERSELREQ